MTSRFARLPAVVALVLVLEACSSNAGATPSTSAASAAAPASAASEAPSTSTATGASPAAAGDACALLAVADVQAALGVSGLTAKPLNAGSDFTACNYTTADGTPVASTTYTPDGAALFDSVKAAQGAVQIPGVADGAVLINPTIYVKKGNALFAIQLASTENLSADKLQQIATAIANAAAAHL